MRDKVVAEQTLYQEEAAYSISDQFGEEHIYYNDNGNPAISMDVLKEFNKLTRDTVVWVRSQRFWRLREPGDEPGRLAEY